MRKKGIPVSRRGFLALSGAGAAGLATSGCTTGKVADFLELAESEHRPAAGTEAWVTSVCGQCEGGCSIRVRTIGGRAIAITESPEEEKIRQYAAKGMEIPWQRVYRVPSHVYFSHRRHVTLGGLDCAACHGDVKGSSVPVTRPAVVLDMKACMDCHQKRQASNDCDGCHR